MSTIIAGEIPAEPENITAESPHPGDEASPSAGDGTRMRSLAIGLVAAAAGFYLLQVLGAFLRPVLVAVLLCYAIWPIHTRLKRGVGSAASLLIIGSALALATFAIGWMVFANASEVWRDFPKYEDRAEQFAERLQGYAVRALPALGRTHPPQGDPIRIPLERVGEYLQSLFGIFSSFVAWAVLVGLYVVFLLVEASGFARAIRRAFPPERAARILDVVDSINEAVIEYLSVKVRVNLLVAIPAGLLMLAFGVRGAVLWGVLTFFARFVPYLGGVAAFVVPVTMAALQFESPVRAALFAVALLVIHVVGEYVVEPVMTGKAVGLSPLIVLLALAFWDLTWGIVGMILAVPLTVILKLALERLPATRPVAQLFSHED
jgi:AI-2 transport protein TqsA